MYRADRIPWDKSTHKHQEATTKIKGGGRVS